MKVKLIKYGIESVYMVNIPESSDDGSISHCDEVILDLYTKIEEYKEAMLKNITTLETVLEDQCGGNPDAYEIGIKRGYRNLRTIIQS